MSIFDFVRRHPRPNILSATRQPLHDLNLLEHLVPPRVTTEERIAIATRCRDIDAVPKVAGAGTIRVTPEGLRTQLMHNGIQVVADGYSGPWMTRLIELCRGHHEPQEERIFHE